MQARLVFEGVPGIVTRIVVGYAHFFRPLCLMLDVGTVGTRGV